MKIVNFGHKFSTTLVGLSLLFILFVAVADVLTQTRRKPTTRKTKALPKSSPAKTPVPTNLRGANEDDENTNSNSGLEITVGSSTKKNVEQSPTFDLPFLENCPKQKAGFEKAICVGIGGGSDMATPLEVEEIHKTISRIFSGKRFVMIKLTGVTLPNQQDEAKSKSCDYFIQTLFKSPFLNGEGTSVWEKIAGLTVSQLPKAVSQLKVATDTTKIDSKGKETAKSDSQRQSDGNKTEKATEGVMSTAGEFLGKVPFFKKDKKFEMVFNVYRSDDISKAFVSLPQESKIKKNSTDDAVANTLYNLMRESTEKMQMKLLNPQAAPETVQDSDSKKKDKNKKDKN